MRKPIIPRSITALAVVCLLAGAAACSGGIGSYVPPGEQRATQSSRALPGQPTPTPVPTPKPLVASVLCTAGLGANCHVLQNTALSPLLDALGLLVPGYSAANLRSAYGLSALPLLGGLLGGSGTPTGPTIAIVNAYDDANAEHDLGVYRNHMGLAACTTANGCFKKLNAALQKGPYPATNRGWTAETSLDLAMASAACPTCKITLIEAGDDSLASLAAIVNTIATPGSSVAPAAISTSWGVAETSEAVAMDALFAHPGVPIVASAGDERVVEFPASSANVISVGGTTLLQGLLSGWSQNPWSSSGVGCSAYLAAGSWQHTTCGKRSVADVSVVADLLPGIAVYDTAAGGWVVYGGTSAGAPFVAGLFAAAHDYPASGIGAAPVYAKASSLKAVAGSNSLGAPNGLGAF
jgi:subtilase family serine protease